MPAVNSDANAAPVLPMHRDRRGWVFEPIDAARLTGQRNCHVVMTEPGAVRGNHYHRVGTEVCAILGPARVCVREPDGVRECHVPAGVVWQFVFSPGVAHAIQNPGPGPLLIVSFNDHAHDPGRPDVVADVLIPPPAPAQA